jgi:hypothetical protein
MTTQSHTVQFHNQTLTAAMVDDIPYVAMKPICENIGLQWNSQFERIRRHPVLSSTIRMTRMVAEDGKIREMLMLPIKYLNGWLFGVDASRVKPEIKERLLEYQRECFDVLSRHFMPQQALPTWKSPITRKAKTTDRPLPKTIQSAISRHAQTLSRRHYDDYHVVLQRMARWFMDVYDLQGEDLIEALQQEDLGWVAYAEKDRKTGNEIPAKPIQENSITLTIAMDDHHARRWLVMKPNNGMVTTVALNDDQLVMTRQQLIESLEAEGYIVMKKRDLIVSLGLNGVQP